jgi:hypothetical protein
LFVFFFVLLSLLQFARVCCLQQFLFSSLGGYRFDTRWCLIILW